MRDIHSFLSKVISSIIWSCNVVSCSVKSYFLNTSYSYLYPFAYPTTNLSHLLIGALTNFLSTRSNYFNIASLILLAIKVTSTFFQTISLLILSILIQWAKQIKMDKVIIVPHVTYFFSNLRLKKELFVIWPYQKEYTPIKLKRNSNWFSFFFLPHKSQKLKTPYKMRETKNTWSILYNS